MKLYNILLFILIIVVNVNCQLTPITNPILAFKFSDLPTNQYSGYPDISSDSSCTFNLRYLVEDLNIDAGPITSFLLSPSPSVTSSARILNSEVAKSLILVSGFVNHGTSGNVNISAVSLTSGQVDYNFNFACNIPDYSDVSIILAQDKPWSLYSNGPYYIKFTIIGLKHYLKIVKGSDGIYSSKTGINYTQEFYWDSIFIKSNTFEPTWAITCIFGPYYISIDAPNPFFGSDIVTISQLTSYPSNPINLVSEFGYNQSPLFTFHSNSIDIPYQYFSTDLPGGEVQPVPFYGTKGNITYIANYISTGSNGIINEFLNYENGTGMGTLPLQVLIQKFPSTVTPVPLVTNYFSNSISMFTSDFTQIIDSSVTFGIYNYNFSGLSFSKSFPFGFISNGYDGFNDVFHHKVSIQKSFNSIVSYETQDFYLLPLPIGQIVLTPITQNTNTNDNTPPEIYAYEYIQLVGQMYVLKVSIRDESGLERFYGLCVKSTIGEALISGDKYDGQYEFIVDILNPISFTLVDSVDKQTTYYDGDYISLNPLTQFTSPEYFTNVQTISNITFVNNDIDVTNDSNYNLMFFKADQYPSNKSMYFEIEDPTIKYSFNDVKRSTWPIYWDNVMGMFACKFIIPRGYVPGNVQYKIVTGSGNNLYRVYNYHFPYENQLRVTNSYVDNSGPIFKLIEKTPYDNYQVIGTSEYLGWRLTITDNIYGFSNGYIKIVGSFDNSIYTFNFTGGNGNQFEFTIDATVLVTSPGISQDFVITNVYLENIGGKYSTYDIYAKETIPFLNPFINYLNDSSINKFTFTCDSSVYDPIPPTLDSFEVYINNRQLVMESEGRFDTIDVGSFNRTLTFKFNSTSSGGLKPYQLPIVYIISKRMEILECQTLYYDIINVTIYSFECTIELPIGFGYPNSLLFSVYGFMGKAGLYSGFTTEDLSSRSLPWYVNTDIIDYFPLITSHERVFSEGGSILLYGRSLDKAISAEILYPVGRGGTYVPINIVKQSQSSMVLDKVKPTINRFFIRLNFTFDGYVQSSRYIVTPVKYITPNYVSPTPQPSPTPSVSPISTCSSNSDCGGGNHGNCIDGNCICNSPWIGLKCNSKIIIVPQPSINTTNPTTEIPTTDSNESIFYKSLISIVSLRELDFKGNQIKLFTFDKWVFNEINNQTSQYITNITSNDSLGNELTTNINITIEWFKDETIIQFANSSLTMNPSSIKYTINIDKYLFSSSLNQLQLVISALFESSSNDQCSIEQFSETDKSNYIKIQIDDHSLYGRFIKRAIIDNHVKTISNVLLNSQLEEITTDINSNSQSLIQSFIGITIPNYELSITIDPDFSVLLDDNSVSNNDENSICNSKSKSLSLSSAQLAGIIIGSIAFAAVVTISITYHVLKKKKDRKFAMGVQNKLKQIDK